MCTSSDNAYVRANSAPAEALTKDRPFLTLDSRPTVRARRAVYISSTEPSNEKTYRYPMPVTSTNTCGTWSACSAFSSRGQGVVSVSSTASETDVATRVTINSAAVRPCWVRPTGVPNQVPSDTTTCPGVTRL